MFKIQNLLPSALKAEYKEEPSYMFGPYIPIQVN